MLSSLTPQQWRIIVALLVVLALVFVALVVVQVTGSDQASTTTSLPSSPTTSLSPATTEATTTIATTTSSLATTTVPVTTTSEATTTTVAETTTSTQATTTTTAPPAGLVLEADGLDAVDFGQGPSTVISTVTAVLGLEPDVDTGWVDAFDNPYGTCPPPEVRGVEWGMLVLFFTSAETDFAPQGTRHFFSYSYAPQPSKPGAGPHGLTTKEGIGLGSSTQELQDAYGQRVQIFDDEIFGPFFAIDLDAESDTALGGTLTSTKPQGKVASVLGGVGCGE